MQPGYDRPRQQVLIGDRDVTERCDSLVYSATDAGGFEIATLGLPSVDRPKKGTPITVRQGCDIAWSGRVAEISDHSQHGRATKTTGCEGYRALLRDDPFSMVYIDRDATRWGAPSTSRQIALAALPRDITLFTAQVGVDTANGLPAIVIKGQGLGATTQIPIVEAWYDAGAGNLISQARVANGAAITYAFPDANNQLIMFTSSDDAASVVEGSANFAGAIPAANFVPVTPRRYVAIEHYYNNSSTFGVAGTTYGYSLANLSAIGNHGLALRGASAISDGFYPSDIARHALSQCSGVLPGTIIDSIGYIAPHVVYRTPTPADTIVDDMAKLMGWTWGVWEPGNLFGSQPRMDFRPPPTDATCVVTKAECDQLDVTSRLGDLYNVAQVTYTDPAGTVGIATVVLANAQLSEAGIAGRILTLNMGAATAASAAAFGAFALALSQIAARAAGQATLPVSVRLPYGGSKPAHLLRPGIDRLRIVDLVDGGPMFDVGTVRRDVFRISRTETTVGKDGTPSTRVELDSGSNLLETLQARLSLAAGVVGSGASGG